jgi:squalene monooxygenase
LADFDALIVGAGPAGCTTAAALGEIGLRVLVVDAGVDSSKQLAGELIHPPGVADLSSLGFASVLRSAGAQSVKGFAVVDASDGGRRSLLPYQDGEGMALDHALLRRSLMEALQARPGIVVRQRARIFQILNNHRHGVEAAIRQDGAGEEKIRARLLVAADGRASHARGLLRIGEARERLSSMLGVMVDAAHLPHPGHGHLFIGGPAPVLGYAITPTKARIMVDLPAGIGATQLVQSPQLLSAMPAALREAVIAASRSGQVLMAANETRLPEAVAVQSAVLVGDAAGCCHPVSASGLSSCTRDARVLQEALQRYPHDVPAALQLYAAKRRAPQRTRISLASALYRTFSEQTPEMAALRVGLFRYWERTRAGRLVSMALLSTRELRMWIMAREYVRAVLHALIAMASRREPRSTQGSVLTTLRLVRSAFPHLRGALAGALEDLRGAAARLLYRASRASKSHDSRAGDLDPSRAPLSR